jgi:iron-sulfur cluster assembly protein
LYSPGDHDHPGNVVYSPEPDFDDNPQHLADIAHAVYALKGTEPENPAVAEVATTISDDFNMVEKQRLPRQLVAAHEVYLAWLIIHRSRLPSGFLCARLVPLLICPEKTTVTMIVPSPYWPPDLMDQWGRLDAMLADAPRRRKNRPAIPAHPGQRDRDAEKRGGGGPVSVTSRAARKIRELAAQVDMGEEFYLAVCVKGGADTGYKVDLAPSWDPQRERCFESRGIRIVVPRDQVQHLEGAVVDFRESVYGAGFSVRRRDA